MNLEDLLLELSLKKIKLSVDENKLRVRAPKGKFTPELHSALKHHKNELIQLLSHAKRASKHSEIRSSILPVDRNSTMLLSKAQERLWQLEQLQSNLGKYNLPMAFRLKGSIDLDILERSLQTIVSRHEVLRCVYPNNDHKPEVVIQGTIPALKIIDLKQQYTTDDQIMRVVSDSIRQPFSIDQGPLIRYTLVQIAPLESLLIIVVHHMVADGWSLGLIISELSTLYNCEAQNPETLPNLAIQYVDFAAWKQRQLSGEKLEPQLKYWRKIFDGSPEALHLPIDRAYPDTPSTQGRCHSFSLDSHLTDDLTNFCQAEGPSRFTALLASFRALLHCYSGQNDLIICSPVAGRNLSDVKNLIGYFNSIIPLRTAVSSDMTFLELLTEEKTTVSAIYNYADVPIQQIANFPSLRKIPLSRALFVLQSQANGSQQVLTLNNMSVQALSKEEMGIDTADFDLAVFIEPCDEQIRGYIQYKTDLFQENTIQRLIEHWKILLERVITHPKSTLAENRPLGTLEREQLINKIDTLNQLLDVSQFKTYVPPGNPTEKKLLEIWSNLLQNQHISTYDNFFDLGGHSLMTVNLFTQIEETFGKTLPPSTIIDAPTIEKLSRKIESTQDAEIYSSLVRLQKTGTKPPVFCIHGAGASILVFRELAHNLNLDHPIYGLQSRGFNGEEHILTSIEDMASAYLEEIRSVQPKGPYHFFGYCMGSLIALEIANRLTSEGEEVAFLAFLEPCIVNSSDQMDQLSWIEKVNRKWKDISKRLAVKGFRYNIDEQIMKIALRIHDFFHLSLPANLCLLRIREINIKAAKKYIPQAIYPHKVTAFFTAETLASNSEISQRWEDLVGQLERYEVPGRHQDDHPESFLKEPNVKALSVSLKKAMNKSLEQYKLGQRELSRRE